MLFLPNQSWSILYNIERPGKPIIKDQNNTSAYANPGAPIYVTAGTGGAILQELDGQSQFVANQFSEIGFLNVNITSDRGKQLQAAFHNGNNGTIMDRFSVTESS